MKSDQTYHLKSSMFAGVILTALLTLGGCSDTDSSSTETSSDTETENTVPQADAGVNQNVNTGTVVTLDASGSSDVDGDTLTYYWATVTVPTSSTAVLSSDTLVSPTFTADVAGTYTFQITVNDGTATATDQVSIIATAATAPGTDSTDGIECDYSYSGFNGSASVNTTSTASWTCSAEERVLAANGIPDHAVGTFPNGANPNTISAQDVAATFTLTPVKTDTATERGGPLGPQGYVLNGVKVDAGTGGSCTDYGDSCSGGDNSGAWSLEALGYTSFDFFGADENNAHVQPDGSYHYHGLPEGFFELRGGSDSTMTLVAWASDGFPIYARYGYSSPNDADSELKVITGSYQHITTVSDARPPVEIYEMGMFRQDWEYVEGSGDLDECNGRFGVTPEFPNGIYHYYATDSYPYFQRCVKGEVESAGGPPPR